MTRSLRQNRGLITLAQLQRLGFGEREVRGLVRHGELRVLHRGVYADGRAPLRDDAHLTAAILAFGGRAWLSGAAAAMGWRLAPVSLPRLEVSVVASYTPSQRPGLRVRSTRRPPHPIEIRVRDGLRLSSIPRLLIEIAATGANTVELHALIEAAVRRNLLDIPDLAATLRRNFGAAGTAGVRRTCDEYLPHLDRKSALERAFDRWLITCPDIPEPQRNVRLGPWEIDCYWPEQRLALELDGRPYHTVVEQIERDHRKNTWLQSHGDRILRVTDSRFRRDRPGVRRDLTALLALGGAGPR
ncbi:MAG TPA: type IV toxin-antitoxin system AbiEi family antitoxin domain-containing protein [Solirubrobacteraceae bacterium]|nr:type IV toxin-antitoxin system AbiEi family antitoxin domain-containing protein [Solirubrobacteraceae bacterium]